MMKKRVRSWDLGCKKEMRKSKGAGKVGKEQMTDRCPNLLIKDAENEKTI